MSGKKKNPNKYSFNFKNNCNVFFLILCSPDCNEPLCLEEVLPFFSILATDSKGSFIFCGSWLSLVDMFTSTFLDDNYSNLELTYT